MKYFIYGNGGGITKTIEMMEIAEDTNEDTFRTIDEILNYLVFDSLGCFNKDNLQVVFYGFDARINKDVFMVTTNRFENRKFDVPQFVKFIVVI